MNKIRLKQKKLFKIMRALVIFGALFIFIFIGVKPTLTAYNEMLAVCLNYFCDILVIAILVVLFIYYSRYGKCESFLNQIENEINDNGYYITSRAERGSAEYTDAISNDLKQCGYSISRNVDINEFDFDIVASKRSEFFYSVTVRQLNRDDIIAHLDIVINHITVKKLKRRGNAVICFITDNADESAIALSKMITPLGRKEQIKIALAVCELSTGNVYFLGNSQSKCQQMIANYVMNCDLPIKDEYIHRDKLKFQYDIENKMKDFTVKDYKDGNFFVH